MSPVAASGAADTSPVRLREWLEGLNIEVPAFDVLPSRLGFELRVAGGSCTGLRLGGAEATRASGSADGLDAEVLLSGLGFSCDADVEAKVLGALSACRVSASTSSSSSSSSSPAPRRAASAASDSGRDDDSHDEGLPPSAPSSPSWLRLSLHVPRNATTGLPSSSAGGTGDDGGEKRLRLQCAAAIELGELRFLGRSLGCEALAAAEGAIRRLVGRLGSELCTAVEAALEPKLAHLVDAAASAAAPLLRPASPLRPPPLPPAPAPGGGGAGAVDLRSELWDAAPGAALREFLRQVGHSDDMAQFDRWLAFVLNDLGLADERGAISVPASKWGRLLPGLVEAAPPFAEGLAFRASPASDLRLLGPEGLGALALGPLGPQTGRVEVAASQNVAANVSVALELPTGQASIEAFGVRFNVSQSAPLAALSLAADGDVAVSGAAVSMFIALNRTALGEFEMDQLEHFSCSSSVFFHDLPPPEAASPARALAAMPAPRLELRPGVETAPPSTAVGSAAPPAPESKVARPAGAAKAAEEPRGRSSSSSPSASSSFSPSSAPSLSSSALAAAAVMSASSASASTSASASSALSLLELRAEGLRVLRASLTTPDGEGAPELLEAELLELVADLAKAAFGAFGEAGLRVADGFASGPGRDWANKQLAAFLAAEEESGKCPASNFSTGEVLPVERPALWLCITFLSATFIAATWVAVAAVAASVSSRRRRCQQDSTPPSSSSDIVSVAAPAQACDDGTPSTGGDDSREGEQAAEAADEGGGGGAGRGGEALGSEPDRRAGLRVEARLVERQRREVPLGWQVSAPLRWAMVLGIVGTTLLFVVATVTPGVRIQVYFAHGSELWLTPDVARLSLDNTVADMIRTHAYFLAFVIIAFSLIWPYAKLLLMLIAWLSPLASRPRGALLVLLDQVGKWSLTDNIVLFLFVVLFWIRWEDGLVPSDGRASSFGLRCIPDTELNAFVAATVLSLILGHAMLAVHRWHHSETDGRSSTAASGDGATAAAGGFASPRCGNGAGASPRQPVREPLCRKKTHKGARPSSAVSMGTSVAILATLALVVSSWCLDIVEVELDGVVAVFQDTIGKPRAQRYSILRVAAGLGKSSLYLQVVFVSFVLVIPALYLTALQALWVVPMRQRMQVAVFTLCQTLGAWASLDVFVAAYLGAVLGGEKYGIAQFLEFVIYNQNIGPACRGLRSAAGLECLTVRMTMLSPAAVLLAAAAAASVVGSYVYRRAHLAMSIGAESDAAEIAACRGLGGAAPPGACATTAAAAARRSVAP